MSNFDLKDKALAVPIRELLEHEGIVVKNNRCCSPFRNEKNPSFVIYPDKNRWIDYGSTDLHRGGDGIDLIKKLKNLSFNGTIDYILRNHVPSSTLIRPSIAATPHEQQGVFYHSDVKHRIDKVVDICHPALMAYLQQRCIPLQIARLFCKEVYYTVISRNNLHFFGIGLKNDNGGWALRTAPYKGNPQGKKLDVVSSGISTIRRESGSISSKAYVFEGFFNFLSWATLFGEPKFDVIVLNSVQNVSALDNLSISGVKELFCFPDNDSPGLNAYKHIAAYSGCDTYNASGAYVEEGCSDWNEYLVKSLVNK